MLRFFKPSEALSSDMLLKYAMGNTSEAESLIISCHIAYCSECKAEIEKYETIGGFYLANHKELNVSPYIQEADLIINTTPIGMNSKNSKEDNVPLGNKIWDCLSNKTILYDLIYTPRPTNWLKLGQQKNCFTIDGLDMLVEQGAFSIRLWSGFNDVPVQIMKSSAEKYLML